MKNIDMTAGNISKKLLLFSLHLKAFMFEKKIEFGI